MIQYTDDEGRLILVQDAADGNKLVRLTQKGVSMDMLLPARIANDVANALVTGQRRPGHLPECTTDDHVTMSEPQKAILEPTEVLVSWTLGKATVRQLLNELRTRAERYREKPGSAMLADEVDTLYVHLEGTELMDGGREP